MRKMKQLMMACLLCSAMLMAGIGLTLVYQSSNGLSDVFAYISSISRPSPAPVQTVPTAAADSVEAQPDAFSTWVSIDIPTLDNTYFIRQLPKEEQLLATKIYQGIAAFEKEIDLPEPVDEETLSEIMWLISYDCPELFQISGDYSYYVQENPPNRVLSLRPTYIMTQSEYEVAQKQVQNILAGWIRGAGAGSAWQMEKYIYDKLITTCAYDESSPHAGSVYGALVLGKARCEGYAKALCMAMRTAGMESLILTGEARTSASNEEPRVEKHAWNVVKVGELFYQLDSTWDDTDGDYPYETCYAYFNLTDREMYRSRTLDDIYKNWSLPSCDDASLSYHALNGFYILPGEDTKEKLHAMMDATYSGERNHLTGKFETDAQMQEFIADMDRWVEGWYGKMLFSQGYYNWITYADSRVFTIFNLQYE